MQTQSVPINFLRGIDTKTDPKQLPPGRLLTLENCVFTTTGALTKRNGYLAYGLSYASGGSLTGAEALAAYGTEAVVLSQAGGGTPGSLNSHTTKGWINNGAFKSAQITNLFVAANSTSNSLASDSAYNANNSLTAVTWQDDFVNSSYVSIFDNSGVCLVNAMQVVANLGPIKPVAVGDYFVFIYYAGGGQLSYKSINCRTSPTTLSGATVLTSSVNTTHPNFDAFVLGSTWYIGFNHSTVNTIGLHSYDSSLSSIATLNVTASGGAVNCLTLWGDTNQLWLAWANTTTTSYATVQPSLAGVITSPTAIESVVAKRITGALVVGSTDSLVAYQASSAPVHTCVISTVAGTPNTSAYGQTIAGKMFVDYGVAFLPLLYDDNGNGGTVFLHQCTSPSAGTLSVIAKWLANNAYSEATPLLRNSNDAGGHAWLLAATSIAQSLPSSSVPTLRAGAMLVTANLAPASTATTTAASTLHCAGGQLWMFDGKSVVEHGFHTIPRISSATQGTGGSLADATYGFILVFEWLDAQGQLHRSAPSLPTFVTVTGGSGTASVAVVCVPLQVTAKQNAQLVLYRTLANGTIYYREVSAANSVSSSTITLTASNTDTAAEASLQLYTTGEVENSPTPPVQHVCQYRDRLVLIPSDNPNSFWYSKNILPASAATAATPVEFSSLFVQTVDQRDGGLVAAAQMDDKLVLFKTNTVYYMSGTGPAVSGVDNDFSTPIQVVAETGCNNAASLVLVPDGLMYQSPKGLYLLDRALQEHYVGADIEGVLGAATVVAATVVPSTTQVRFLLNNGTALVYDYRQELRDARGYGQWSVFTNHTGIGAIVWGGSYTYVASDGTLNQERSDRWQDNFVPYNMKLVTGWLSLAALQGFQRVRDVMILGNYYTAHQLQVQAAYDFSSTPVQSNTIAVSTAPVRYQYRVQLARQKCESLQLTITESDSSDTGQAVQLSGLALTVGVKSGNAGKQTGPASVYG